MKLINSVWHGLNCLQGVTLAFALGGHKTLGWQNLNGALNVHFWVGTQGEWILGKMKDWDGESLPDGGKRSTWQQVLCYTE